MVLFQIYFVAHPYDHQPPFVNPKVAIRISRYEASKSVQSVYLDKCCFEIIHLLYQVGVALSNGAGYEPIGCFVLSLIAC